MATASQITANQANAQKSTGPKTPEGKAKSRLNHFSHGFFSSTPVIPGEDPEEFVALLVDLTREFKPMTATEQLLIESMVLNQWLTLRAYRLQSELFMLREDRAAIPKDLGLLVRYHTAAERGFHKAHNELVKTQKERKKSEIGFEPQNEWAPPLPVPAPIEDPTETGPKSASVTAETSKFPVGPAPSGAPGTERTWDMLRSLSQLTKKVA